MRHRQGRVPWTDGSERDCLIHFSPHANSEKVGTFALGDVMPIPAAFDEQGRLIQVVPSDGLASCIEAASIVRGMEPQCQVKETFATPLEQHIDKCRAFLSRFEDGFMEFATKNDVDVRCLRLCILGFMEQRYTIAQRILGIGNYYWVTTRCSNLQRMGMWVGNNELGDRFGAWLEPDSGFQVLLDVMEIDGELISKVRNGERYYQLNPRYRRPKRRNKQS